MLVCVGVIGYYRAPYGCLCRIDIIYILLNTVEYGFSKMYICTYVCVHTHRDIYTYIYIYIYISISIHSHTHTHAHIHMCIYIHMFMVLQEHWLLNGFLLCWRVLRCWIQLFVVYVGSPVV